ncbi:hypothetical protein EC988_004744, partial [Linderina pennispora]
QGLTAFEDSPNPTSRSWYGSGYRNKVSSATDYSTSDPTPTGDESRESVLETLAPPHNTDKRVTSRDKETEATSTSSIVWTTLYYPFGVMANADYRLSIELVKTKSDVGPARYNIDMHAVYSDSVTQYTKTVEFASQMPFRIVHLAYTAFEDNPRLVYDQAVEDEDDAGSSEEELDTVELTPTSADATSLVPETPTPTPHINEVHIEL